MRVIVLGPYPLAVDQAITGPGRVMYNLCSHICKQTIMRILNISLNSGQKRQYPDEGDGTEYQDIAPYHLLSIGDAVVSFKPDIVHIHGMLPPFHVPHVVRWLQKARFKIVYTVHGLATRETYNFPVKYLFPRVFQRILLQQVDSVVAISEYTRELVHSDYQIPLQKISVITHGVDDMFYQPVEPLMREESRNKRVILYVGGEKWVKGLDFLFETLRKSTRSDWVLWMAGSQTHYGEQLRSQFADLYDSGKVVRLGYLDQTQLIRAYAAASLCVLPSRWDQFGLAGLETMATGKPVIVSDRVGMRSLIRDGQNGFVAEYGNHDQWNAMIGQLLDDDLLCKKIGQNAQMTARGETWSNKASAYLDLYSNIHHLT